MKIIIDGTSLARKITGIENYTLNLIKHLGQLDYNPENSYYILFRNEVPKDIKFPKNFKTILSPFKSQLLTEQIWIPFITYKLKPDLIHFPAFPPPLLVKKNTIFTVFDATMWKYVHTLSLKNRLYMKPLTNRGIKIANKIITISNSSKNDLEEMFPGEKEKITNSGISISKNFFPEKNKILLSKIKTKYQLPTNFFLTVGSLEPRKNLVFLIESFIEFKKQNKNNYKLVITGRNAWGKSEIFEMVQSHNMNSEIIFTGYVSDNELRSLYSLSDYFVFPSIYEGFGLPVLEAMACGTPVIISNSSSLPEVGGDAAIYFNPKSKESLITALLGVINESYNYRELQRKCLERQTHFSWNEVAHKINEEYKRVYNKITIGG
ncbi:glycosyltransferase family 1 protein [Bacillus sp. NEB1478]|uniref:glycosyltransferase family 4 protein n=1 Tax=Bacillus sp. NEB1478 TaxID=3073816 RepID=UPI00287346B9|nr:glycosyltransferase family 1 protein [Bacillus sp. NEB1478]WNB92507.1 glycosyltransferase family 1 protein [Bacillus sp. NEB1478]